MKAPVTVKFGKFWPTFDCDDNHFIKALRKHREVKVLQGDSTVKPDIFIYNRLYDNDFFNYDCVKVVFTGENDFPNFNECDYGISFYPYNCGGRNLRYPLWMMYEVEQAVAPPYPPDDEAFTRGFCTLVMKNSRMCDLQRLEIIDAVEQYKPITYGGPYRNNVGGPVDEKIPFIAGYKFNLALENSIVDGYVTEKILEAFAGATVPIYWGTKDVSKDFNPEAYINVNDYATIDSFIRALEKLDNDKEAYLKMLHAPTFVGETAARLEDELVEFLDGIADNLERRTTRYGMMGAEQVYNRFLLRLTRMKGMWRIAKIANKLIR